MQAAMRKSLPPNQIVLFEFQKEDSKVSITPPHKMSKKQVRKEITHYNRTGGASLIGCCGNTGRSLGKGNLNELNPPFPRLSILKITERYQPTSC